MRRDPVSSYGDRVPQVTRADVLAFRVRAHQLDRTAGTLADTTALDLGVQDTGAALMREIAATPTVKGEMSRQLTERMDPPYLRDCRPCQAVHAYEQTFRLAALRAGLELQPDTSPPVLRPVPGFVPAAVVPAHLDVVRGYLRLHGPATPQQVAAYLDAPVKDVREHWPADAVEVQVDGERRWLLAADVDRLGAGPARTTRLLGPFDPYLQTRDRALLVPDEARTADLWRVLGRPGAVLVDGEVAGTWRPRKTGRRLTVQVDPWRDVPTAALEQEAERLAAVRGTELAGLAVGG